MSKAYKKIPVIGPAISLAGRFIRRTTRKLRGLDGSGRKPFVFERKPLPQGEGFGRQQVINLLHYTKTSGSIYNGQDFPAGYHSINLTNLQLQGQRNLDERYARIPIDFTGKTVLDIGSNQGGMLFAIADRIKHGTGIDYERRLVNAASKIRTYTGNHHLEFFTFDLVNDDLEIIRDLIPAPKVDIVFLLAVCVHIPNWRNVIDLTAQIADQLLFEANGRPDQQAEQLAYLHTRWKKVEALSNASDDRHLRSLYICSN